MFDESVCCNTARHVWHRTDCQCMHVPVSSASASACAVGPTADFCLSHVSSVSCRAAAMTLRTVLLSIQVGPIAHSDCHV